MYGEDTGPILFSIVKSDLHMLFDDYMNLDGSNFGGSQSVPSSPSAISVPNARKSISLLKAKFRQYKLETSGSTGNKKSEL